MVNRSPPAATVRHTPAFCDEPFADVNISSIPTSTEARIAAFDQTLVGDKASAIVFVRQIGPYQIIENMSADSIDDLWQRYDALGFFPVFQPWSIDCETAHVVEMRMSDKEGVDQFAEYVEAIGFGRDVRKCQSVKWSFFQDISVAFRGYLRAARWHVILEDSYHTCQVRACVHSYYRALCPFRSSRPDQEARNLIFARPTASTLEQGRVSFVHATSRDTQQVWTCASVSYAETVKIPCAPFRALLAASWRSGQEVTLVIEWMRVQAAKDSGGLPGRSPEMQRLIYDPMILLRFHCSASSPS